VFRWWTKFLADLGFLKFELLALPSSIMAVSVV
jgi:hypothetical protein